MIDSQILLPSTPKKDWSTEGLRSTEGPMMCRHPHGGRAARPAGGAGGSDWCGGCASRCDPCGPRAGACAP